MAVLSVARTRVSGRRVRFARVALLVMIVFAFRERGG